MSEAESVTTNQTPHKPVPSTPAERPAQGPFAARLEAVGITKDFPGVRALDDVHLFLRSDETVGIVGENGAGKTTLFDILSGLQQPSGGQLRFDGQPVVFHGARDAVERGIFRVFQEQALIGQLTVYENLCLGMEDRFSLGGVLRKERMKKHAESALEELGLSIDASQLVRRLSFGTRQLIELARVVAMARLLDVENPVVLLDEPTASLSGSELQLFFDLLKNLRGGFHASVLFVSHRLLEVLDVSDRVYVMKDGRTVAEVQPTVAEGELHRLMVGRDRALDFYCGDLQTESFGSVLLEVRNLSNEAFRGVSFSVRQGEIVGLGGLLGSGKSEVGRAVFGALPHAGEVRVSDQLMSGGLQNGIRAGIGYIPIDRHSEGVLLGRSIVENVTLASLNKLSPRGIISSSKEYALTQDLVSKVRVKASSIRQPTRSLSGGNQQKVVIAKWLGAGLRVLIADNPTRGVDAGAKEEIYRMLRNLAAEGVGILLITDDLLELIGLSNRIIVMKDGEVTGEVGSPAGAKPAEHEIVRLMV